MATGMKDYVRGDATADSYTVEIDAAWSSSQAKNGFTGDTISLAGLNRSFDHYDGMGGNDTITATSGGDALIYDTTGSAKDADPAHYVSIERFDMGLGNDVLDLTSSSGGAASYGTGALAFGDAAGDLTSGIGGRDVLWGGGGNDTIDGDAFALAGVAGGDDRLVGGAGNDVLFGDANSIKSAGGVGGNDLLDGGTGDDLLFGDAAEIRGPLARGHNTFVFDGPGSGADTIGDAIAANGFQHGLDHIQLKGSYGYANGAAALAHTTDTGAGGYAQVDLGHGDGIALFGVHKADLTADDFVIA